MKTWKFGAVPLLALSLAAAVPVGAQGPPAVGLRAIPGTAARHPEFDLHRHSLAGSNSGMSPGEKGALIGAAVGFVAGTIFFTAMNRSEGHSGILFVGGLILAVPLAVIGGLIGHAAR